MLHKQLTTKRVIDNLTEIELAIESACKDLLVDGIDAYLITLAVSELASNVIRHSTHDGLNQDDICLEVFCLDNTVKIVLQDSCKPLPESVVSELLARDGTVAAYDTTVQNIPEHGWGLDLISHAPSSVSYARREPRNVYELMFEYKK